MSRGRRRAAAAFADTPLSLANSLAAAVVAGQDESLRSKIAESRQVDAFAAPLNWLFAVGRGGVLI